MLHQANQAQQLIAEARQLRQSLNTDIREHLYINMKLTRAGAEAAYHMRRHRRLFAQNRANRLSNGEPVLEQSSTHGDATSAVFDN